MKTITEVKSEIENLELYYYNDKNIIDPEISSINCTVDQLATAIETFINKLKNSLAKDLKDIWERQNKIESMQ